MLKGKKILITGGTGSWGNELVRQLIVDRDVSEIRILSRNEHKQVEMSYLWASSKVKFILGDIRNIDVVNSASKDIDVLFHLAALKHVPVCENNSWEAVSVNVNGTQTVINSAMYNNVGHFVLISTDKAVDPFNLYGVTKSLAEKLVINANFNYISSTKFVCIRAGNVVGTNGSVIPLFKNQILSKNKITITDYNMTRYLMRTSDAIKLIFVALENSVGGEIFVVRMPAVDVKSLAEACINIYGDEDTEQEIIGLRPGEKIDEVLVSKNESFYTRIYNDDYYVILPQLSSDFLTDTYAHFPRMENMEFNSRNAEFISMENLKILIKELN